MNTRPAVTLAVFLFLALLALAFVAGCTAGGEDERARPASLRLGAPDNDRVYEYSRPVTPGESSPRGQRG